MVASFGTDFTSALLANLVGGAIVAAAVYLFIEYRLSLRRDREARREMTRAVLSAVRDELDYNALQVELFEKHLPKDELPWPGFDVNGWTLISQATVFVTLHKGTLAALVPLYNRLRSANDYHQLANEIMFGTQGFIAYAAVLGIQATGAAVGGPLINLFNEKRNEHRDRMLDRVRELKPVLASARERLDAELALLDHVSSQRHSRLRRLFDR